jgi:PBP1b-binding outer membrane lipoprotein LpoB
MRARFGLIAATTLFLSGCVSMEPMIAGSHCTE